MAVLAGVGMFDRAAEYVVEKLHTITDTQHRHAEGEDLLVKTRRALFINAVGAAGEDDAAQAFIRPGGHGSGVVEDLTVYTGLAHAAGDELVVLAAKVQYDDLF